jgi:hypothetical protein
MGNSTRPGAARLKEILRRQSPPRCGKEYEPAIKAFREEAPSISWVSRVYWNLLDRKVHFLSRVEQAAGFLAMSSPQIWELQEQRMLPVIDSPHPLSYFGKESDRLLPRLPGTLEVAEKLGLIKHHPLIKVPNKDGSVDEILFPWIGDLLLYLKDSQGCYCVNWTIKGVKDNFENSNLNSLKGKTFNRNDEKSWARHVIEESMYAAAGIRTVRITGEDLNVDINNNLRQLWLWHHRETKLSSAEAQEIIGEFAIAMIKEVPPIETVLYLHAEFGFEIDDIKAVLYQAISKRFLKVDLTWPIILSEPLNREVFNIWDRTAHLFARSSS